MGPTAARSRLPAVLVHAYVLALSTVAARPAALARRSAPSAAKPLGAALRARGGAESFFGDLLEGADAPAYSPPPPAEEREERAPRSLRLPRVSVPAGALPAGAWLVLRSASLVAAAASGVFVGRSTAQVRIRGVP